MITKKSDGTSLSANYGTVVQGDTRSFLAKLSVNGTDLNAGIRKLIITKGSCGGDQFAIGSVYSASLVAELFDLSTNVKGQDIKVEIGLEVNGVYEYITVGYFTATEVKTTAYVTTINAYGHSVSKTGGTFTVPATQNISGLISAIQTATGVTISIDTMDTSYVVNGDMTGLTCYQALQSLASLVGGYVMDNADGSISIKKFSTTSTLSVDSGLMVMLPDIEEADFTVRGATVTAGEDVYTYGTVDIEVENPYMTQDIFTNLFVANLVGYSYRPATIGLSMGDPRIEGNDVLTVTDINSNTYTVPCHQVTHTYDGGFYTNIIGIRATQQAVDEATPAPISSKIVETAKNVATISRQVSEVSAIASNTDQYFWFTSTGTDTGAHITEVPQDEFTDSTSPNYQSGGNLLARSNGIAVRDGLTELSTFGTSGMRIGKTDEKHIEVLPSAFNVYEEDGSVPFSVSTENSLTTWTHGMGVNLTASSGNFRQYATNVFLKGSLTDNRVYFGVTSSGYPTTFNDYITLPSSPSSYPTSYYLITVNGVECLAKWVERSTIGILFNNTSNSARFPAMQITEKYYETWIKANDAQLSVSRNRMGLIDTTGTSDASTTYARTYGHMVSVAIGVYNTNSIANNGIIYQGNLMNLVPSASAVLVGYRGGFVYGYISSNGAIAVYNATGGTVTSSSSQPIVLYGTYIYQ